MRYPHVNAPRFVGSPNAMIYCTFFLPLQNINAPSKWNLSWFKLDERSNELFVADVNRNAVGLNSMGASEALGDPVPIRWNYVLSGQTMEGDRWTCLGQAASSKLRSISVHLWNTKFTSTSAP